jgi:hypothetical protein
MPPIRPPWTATTAVMASTAPAATTSQMIVIGIVAAAELAGGVRLPIQKKRRGDRVHHHVACAAPAYDLRRGVLPLF